MHQLAHILPSFSVVTAPRLAAPHQLVDIVVLAALFGVPHSMRLRVPRTWQQIGRWMVIVSFIVWAWIQHWALAVWLVGYEVCGLGWLWVFRRVVVVLERRGII